MPAISGLPIGDEGLELAGYQPLAEYLSGGCSARLGRMPPGPHRPLSREEDGTRPHQPSGALAIADLTQLPHERGRAPR